MTETRRAFIVVWLILSVGAAAILSAFLVLPEETILGLSQRGRLPSHGDSPCPFCGMTRGFLAISNGDAGRAVSINRGAVPLFAGFVLNEVLAVLYLARRMRASRPFRLRTLGYDGRVHC